MNFKFKEQRNLAVFTTKQVLEGQPILFVYHNLDGYWQFHSSREPHSDDAKIISLEEAVKLDGSLNELSQLKAGCCAWRSSILNEWETGKDEEQN